MSNNWFVKIYGQKLLNSSLWDECWQARLVFIGLLAEADEHGYVDMPTMSGLSRRLNMSVEDTQTGLAVLEAPDPASRTETDDGTRVIRKRAGWQVINYTKYREFRSDTQEETAARVRRFREAKKAAASSELVTLPLLHVTDVTSGNVTCTPEEEEEEEKKREREHEREGETQPAQEPETRRKRRASAKPKEPKEKRPRARTEKDDAFDLVVAVFEEEHAKRYGASQGIGGKLNGGLVSDVVKWLLQEKQELREAKLRSAAAGYFADSYWNGQKRHPFGVFAKSPGSYLKPLVKEEEYERLPPGV